MEAADAHDLIRVHVGESPSTYRARDHTWTEGLAACLVRVALRPVRNREAATTGSG